MEPTLRAVAASARRALRAHRASCYLLSPDGAVLRGRPHHRGGSGGARPARGPRRPAPRRLPSVVPAHGAGGPGARGRGRARAPRRPEAGAGDGRGLPDRGAPGALLGAREPGRADAGGPVRELLRAAQLLDPRAGGGPEPRQHGQRGGGQRAPARADRSQPGGGARAGDARSPHRPAEPPRLPGASGPRGGPRPPARTSAVAGALRSRPLQAGQRHPRPPGRRRGAGGGGPPPGGRLAAGGRGGADRGRGVRLAAARGRRARGLPGRRARRARPSRRARWGSPAR